MGKGLVAVVAVVAVVGLSSSVARADVQHTVARGHTLQAIANRYRVTVKSIVEANHIKDPSHLKVGAVLVIPKVDPPKAKDGKDAKDKDAKARSTKDAKGKADAKNGKPDAKNGKADAKNGKPTTYAAKPKTPGVIHIRRAGTSEEADLRLTDKRGKIAASTLKAMEKMLRFPSGQAHPIEPRLVSLLGLVSNHFGSRKIEVVSGFRPYSPTQYTAHSNHNHGKAVDFRVIGVPNEAVRDFCRTLKKTGCGYYPNSVFVHMDVREAPAFWIDYSRPGEPPRYNAPNLDADEGTSDVHGDAHPAANTPPVETEATAELPSGASSPAPSATESDPPPATKPDGE